MPDTGEKMRVNRPKKDNILLEFSMTPISKGESVSRYVARSLEIIEKSGLDYRVNPMGTVTVFQLLSRWTTGKEKRGESRPKSRV